MEVIAVQFDERIEALDVTGPTPMICHDLLTDC
jgi:hypothetical protein